MSLGVAGVSFAGPTLGDTDGDGVDDLFDNCRDISNTDQRDPDGDGCGAICDGDYTQDGIVGGGDFGIFRAALSAVSAGNPGFVEDADMTGDGVVGGGDFGIFRQQLGAGSPGVSKASYRNLAACP
jgi:hypothetical protein